MGHGDVARHCDGVRHIANVKQISKQGTMDAFLDRTQESLSDQVCGNYAFNHEFVSPLQYHL